MENNFLTLLALFGYKSFLSFSTVKSLIVSPFFNIIKFKTEISGETIQPLTDFLHFSPFLIRKPLHPTEPFGRSNLTLLFVNTPFFIGKPCLSCPPVILKT